MKINLQYFFQNNLLITTIAKFVSLLDMTLLNGKAFSHSTKKYKISVMSNLCKCLKGMALTVHIVLYFSMRIICPIYEMCYLMAKVSKMTLYIIYYIV